MMSNKHKAEHEDHLYNDFHDDFHYDELREARKRKIIKIMSFTVVFFTFIILALGNGLPYVIGSLKSTPVEDGIISTGSVTIRFEGEALELLQSEYFNEYHREIRACLSGRIDGSDYYVSTVHFPRVIDASIQHIKSEACPQNTLIDLHSHPLNSCIASSTDLRSFAASKEINPNILMVIMCAKDKFSVYE